MSAYILDDKTFNQLASELFSRSLGSSKFEYAIRDFFGLERYEDFDTAKAKVNQKVAVLRNANFEAVNQRYNDNTAPNKLKFTDEFMIWSDMKLYKTLTSLRYQMSEGTVFDSSIYKEFDNFIKELAEVLVRESDEYQTSKGW